MLDCFETLVWSILLLVVVMLFMARQVVVDGSSMVPGLHHGDRLLLRSIGYQPAAGDVVVVDGYNRFGEPLVKRIIAEGGDTLDIDFEAGVVIRNGQPLEEPYLAEPTTRQGDMTFPLTVPQGMVFVMGDNRQHSTDSRDSTVGFVDERNILGKVELRVFPLSQIGRIK